MKYIRRIGIGIIFGTVAYGVWKYFFQPVENDSGRFEGYIPLVLLFNFGAMLVSMRNRKEKEDATEKAYQRHLEREQRFGKKCLSYILWFSSSVAVLSVSLIIYFSATNMDALAVGAFTALFISIPLAIYAANPKASITRRDDQLR